MATAKVQSLLVDLQVQSATLREGLNQARGLFGAFGHQVSGVLAGLNKHLEALSVGLRQVTAAAGRMKAAASNVAQVAGALTAVGGAAIALAAQVDGPTKAAVDGLKRESQLLAVQVARMLLPALQEVGAILHRIAQWIAGLSPELKASIVHWAGIAATVALAAKALSMVVGLGAGVAGIFSGIAGAIAAIGIGPILAVVAGVAALAVVAALLHKAWRENWGGIQQVTAEVFGALKDQFKALATVAGLAFDFVVDAFRNVAMAALASVEALDLMTGSKLIGKQTLEGWRAGLEGAFKNLKSGQLLKSAVELGKTVAEKVGEGAKSLADELESMLEPVLEKVRGLLGAKGQLVEPEDWQVDVGTVGQVESEFAPAGGIFQSTSLRAPRAPRELAMTPDKLGSVSAGMNAQMLASLSGATQLVVSRLGEFGSVLSSVVQGAQQGGWAGALAGLLADLLSRTGAFAQLVEVGQGVVREMVQAVEPLMAALLPGLSRLVTVIGRVVATLAGVLGPVFDVLGVVVEALAPILELVAIALQGLAPVLKVLLTVSTVVFRALEPVMRALFEVARPILSFVLSIATVLVKIWNGIIGAIADVVQTVLTVITGWIPGMQNFAKDVADGIRGLMGDAGAIEQAQAALNELDFGGAAGGLQSVASSAERSTVALEAFTEALTNAPSGFKIAAARFGADNGGQGPRGSGASGGYRGPGWLQDQVRKGNVARTGNPSGGDEGGEGGMAPGGAHNPSNWDR